MKLLHAFVTERGKIAPALAAADRRDRTAGEPRPGSKSKRLAVAATNASRKLVEQECQAH